MKVTSAFLFRSSIALSLAAGLSLAWTAGCGGSLDPDAARFASYLLFPSGGAAAGGSGPTGTGGSSFDSSGIVSPCNEPFDRRFVTISMRNTAPDDFIHYFLLLGAFIQSETYPEGTVCPDDVPTYTMFGYEQIAEGTELAFGDYCFRGPMLLYFHREGRFRGVGSGATSTLASGIAPARGTSATYDDFFNAVGARVPAPSFILFHNPGSGAGAPLLIANINDRPCDPVFQAGTSRCAIDAFYYVDDTDRIAGSTRRGNGSGVRVPSEIQGTSCECRGFSEPFQTLASSEKTASSPSLLCSEYLRGGRIEFVFLRDDTDPPYPQLVWRVTDASGSVAHEFDPRAAISP